MSENPFTRFLRGGSSASKLDEFVAYWDALEGLMVRVYRGKETAVSAEPEFVRVWPWLREHYPRWQAALHPFWRETKAGGAPVQSDPFQLLLDLETPQAIVDNWTAMQHLPAAREALNQYILTLSPE